MYLVRALGGTIPPGLDLVTLTRSEAIMVVACKIEIHGTSDSARVVSVTEGVCPAAESLVGRLKGLGLDGVGYTVEFSETEPPPGTEPTVPVQEVWISDDNTISIPVSATFP